VRQATSTKVTLGEGVREKRKGKELGGEKSCSALAGGARKQGSPRAASGDIAREPFGEKQGEARGMNYFVGKTKKVQ